MRLWASERSSFSMVAETLMMIRRKIPIWSFYNYDQKAYIDILSRQKSRYQDYDTAVGVADKLMEHYVAEQKDINPTAWVLFFYEEK